jgi:hypothetical protein
MNRTPALAYLRTSSATNIGADKDSDKRQREAIQAFAKRAGFEIAAEFYDAAVSGADAIETRRASQRCWNISPARACARSSSPRLAATSGPADRRSQVLCL